LLESLLLIGLAAARRNQQSEQNHRDLGGELHTELQRNSDPVQTSAHLIRRTHPAVNSPPDAGFAFHSLVVFTVHGIRRRAAPQ
jgi:hypothetical protein